MLWTHERVRLVRRCPAVRPGAAGGAARRGRDGGATPREASLSAADVRARRYDRRHAGHTPGDGRVRRLLRGIHRAHARRRMAGAARSSSRTSIARCSPASTRRGRRADGARQVVGPRHPRPCLRHRTCLRVPADVVRARRRRRSCRGSIRMRGWRRPAASRARSRTRSTSSPAVRQATLAMLRTVPDEDADRRGVANGNPMTVRACGWMIAGHAQHHLDGLRELRLG